MSERENINKKILNLGIKFSLHPSSISFLNLRAIKSNRSYLRFPEIWYNIRDNNIKDYFS